MTLFEANDTAPTRHAASPVAAELTRIARRLDQLAQAQLTELQLRTGVCEAAFCPVYTYAEFAKRLYDDRRRREALFSDGLFADPAWDMLLDLFIAYRSERRISVSSLCIASVVPPTTALRWINNLEEEGLVARLSDPADRRRMFVTLTPTGKRNIRMYLDQLTQAWSILIRDRELDSE